MNTKSLSFWKKVSFGSWITGVVAGAVAPVSVFILGFTIIVPCVGLLVALSLITGKYAQVKIEKKLAPRSLSPKAVLSLVEKLKPFTGIKVDLRVMTVSNPDAIPFFKHLESLFNQIGWVTYQSFDGAGYEYKKGVTIKASSLLDEKTNDAAAILVEGFTADGVSTTRIPSSPSNEKGVIIIKIGTKI